MRGHPWRIGLSYDMRAPDGSVCWGDIGLASLAEAGVTWEFLAADQGELTAEHVAGFDAVIFAGTAITASTVSGRDRPILLARFGVGLDAVDLDACTAAGVAVTITPDGARRAVATAALSLILAVDHRLIVKDRLVRQGRWQERMTHMGRGLTGRTVGVVGLGGIAHELFDLLRPFGTRNLAADPFRHIREAAAEGIELVELDTLMAHSDIIVITAALSATTHHLVNAQRISLMRPDAVLVNVARGPIVDTAALAAAVATGRIRGAGLDVFEVEPLPPDDLLTALDNVVLSPHSLAWTDEMALGNGSSAIRAILDLRANRLPQHLANPGVTSHPAFATHLIAERG